jgi:hypothetical protein
LVIKPVPNISAENLISKTFPRCSMGLTEVKRKTVWKKIWIR